MKALTYALALSFATGTITGCTTINPYTNESQVSKATTGSIIGGLAGAVIGVASSSKSDRAKGALIGAGIGAIAGGGAGYYMDVQEAKLRKKLQGSGVSVTRVGDNIILNMPGNVTFASNSSDINARFYDVINSVALVLQEYKSTLINIEGHSDSAGKASYNQKLSLERAASVAKLLKMKGVATERMAVIGHGESQPIADNNTQSGRAANRRVEIILQPITE